MLKRFLNLCALIGVVLLNATAQNKCGTDILHKWRINNDPSYTEFRLQSEALLNSSYIGNKSASIIKIPVVIHVVYFEDSLHQNVSTEQVHSQIDVLNKDFNKLNWDTMKAPQVWKNLIADCEIEFVLANRDPNGNVTTGITRRSTDINEIGDVNGDLIYSTAKGGQDIWDRDSYLNIWVCSIKGGIYGFSGFPGSPSESDGIVVDYKSFGSTGTATAPTHLGRTLTHELGHWFNLFHLWGTSECGDDLVNDTPMQEKANYDCPFFPTLSTVCPNGPNGDMYNNYMDYADDNCMNMFTNGQKNRMISALNSLRPSLFNSKGYNTVNENHMTSFKLYPCPTSDFVSIELSERHFVQEIQIISLQGSIIRQKTIGESLSNYKLDVNDIENGIYLVKLYFKNGIVVKRMTVWR